MIVDVRNQHGYELVVSTYIADMFYDFFLMVFLVGKTRIPSFMKIGSIRNNVREFQ